MKRTAYLLTLAATVALNFSGCGTVRPEPVALTPEQAAAKEARRARWGEAGLSVLRFGLNVLGGQINSDLPPLEGNRK